MAHPSTVWYLKQVDLFSGITDSEMMKIANKAVEKKCLKKELLYTPFQTSDFICILKKGEVALYHDHEGKKYVIDVLYPGAIFGNISFAPKVNDHFAEVIQDAYICFIPISDFIKILQAKPEIMMKLLTIQTERLSSYEEKLKNQFLDARERVLRYLGTVNHQDHRGLLSEFFWKRTKLTHTRIAHETGLSRETVSRIMGELKKEQKL